MSDDSSRKSKRARRLLLQQDDSTVAGTAGLDPSALSTVTLDPTALCSVEIPPALLCRSSVNEVPESAGTSSHPSSSRIYTAPQEIQAKELVPELTSPEMGQFLEACAPNKVLETHPILSTEACIPQNQELIAPDLHLLPKVPTFDNGICAPIQDVSTCLVQPLETFDSDRAFDLKGFSWIHDPIPSDEDSPMFPDLPDILTEPQTEWNETVTTSDLGTNENDNNLYDDARITRVESAVAIISFIQSEHLSGAGTARLLSLIGLHLPENNNFFKTSNELFGVLGNNDQPPNIFHFCSLCLKSRASSLDLCDSCSSDKKTIHYFIQFPLEPQIKKMYMRPGFLKDIQYKKTRVKVDRDNYEDVYDGNCYQEAEKDFLADSNNISFMWNTDGVQVFESSLMSMWVFYLVINELPPHKRFLTENMLIAGIWCSSAKPHPNIFLQPIYNDLQTLQNGIFVKFFNDPTEHKVICKLLCGTMDSPARSTFLNMKSHSGFYSCFLCLCKGVKNKESAGVTVFPFEENFPQRTLEDYCDHVKYAVENRVLYNKALLNEDQCCGIKGPTLLYYMLNNMFLSTAIDPMHCVYLGVMRQMLNLMTSSDYSEEPFSVHDKISTINSRIKKVKVPHFVERPPQGVDKLVHWKASELRNFMFYICLLVLNGVLKPEYFDHLKLFVRGVALLNKSSVSKDDIRESNNLLREFVKKFQILYGLRHMSSNLHLLLHLPSCVEQLGVLWAIGCFWFEDMNGRVLNLIHGTRHIGLQVCTNLAVLTGLPLKVHKLKNESVRRFCLQMRYKWLNVKISEKICERVFCVGNLYPIGDDNLWIVRELVQSHVVSDPEECSISIFHRLLKKRVLFTSASYKQCVSVSTYVQYNFANTTLYGNIQAFVKVQEVSGDVHFYAVVNRFQETEAFETQHLLQVRPLMCKQTLFLLMMY